MAALSNAVHDKHSNLSRKNSIGGVQVVRLRDFCLFHAIRTQSYSYTDVPTSSQHLVAAAMSVAMANGGDHATTRRCPDSCVALVALICGSVVAANSSILLGSGAALMGAVLTLHAGG